MLRRLFSQSVDVGAHPWVVLPGSLAAGRSLYEALRVGKVERSLSDLGKYSAKKSKVTFKEREPWG